MDQREELNRLLREISDSGKIRRFTFLAFSANHSPLYEFSQNPFAPTEPIAILSASKWVSAVLLLSLVEEGKLSLDAKISEFFSPLVPQLQGNLESLTLRHLLSFTSGVDTKLASYQDANSTLATSSADILQNFPLDSTPGQAFRYGDAHLQLAGYLAEQVSGKSWQSLFEEKIRNPLGMSGKPEFFAKPRKTKGRNNPRPGAGLLICLHDFLLFQRMIWEKGTTPRGSLLSSALIDEMEKLQADPSIVPEDSELRLAGIDSGYGFGVWVERPSHSKSLVTSPGYYGFCPWIDRRAGYYAVFAAQEQEPAFSAVIELMAQIRSPLEILVKENPHP